MACFGEIRKIPANSLGSGFIVHPNGYLVTNHHVVDRAREIIVELSDGRRLQADLISSDAESDLAVLKMSDERPFPTIKLGDSSDLLVVEPLTPLIAQRYGFATEDGMYVTEVARGSTAARAGIEAGDVIVSLGRYRVRTLKDFATLMQVMPQSGQVRVGVIRGNQVGYGMLQL